MPDVTIQAVATSGFVSIRGYGYVAAPLQNLDTPRFGEVPLRAFGNDPGPLPARGDQNLANRTVTQSNLKAQDPSTVSSGPIGGGPEGQTVDSAHRAWHSIGDPHIKMGGEYFDNTHVGNFLLIQSQDKTYQVQARQEGFGPGPNAPVANTAVAIRDRNDIVTYDAKTHQLLLNGNSWNGRDQPEGLAIEKAPDGYKITSRAGDELTLHDRGNYLDLVGKIGPARTEGEMRGAHGVFDNTDGAESHVKRDGTRAPNRDSLIDDWRVQDDEDLFKTAGNGGPDSPPPDLVATMATEILLGLTRLVEVLSKLLSRLEGQDDSLTPVLLGDLPKLPSLAA